MKRYRFRFLAIGVLSLFLISGCVGGGGDSSAPPSGDTGGGGDNGGGTPTALAVVSTTPADAATGVDLNVVISATFNQEVDPATISDAGTFVVLASGGPVIGTVSLSSDSKTAIFTPVTPMALAVPYNVTIKKGVKGKSGSSMSDDHKIKFTCREGGWAASAAPVETSDTGDAILPQIAADSNGNAIAVWEKADDAAAGIHHIFANRFDAGKGWGIPVLIEDNVPGDAMTPQIAMDESGKAIAVWVEFDGLKNEIYANQFEPGKGWSGAVIIDKDTTGDVFNPHVAMDNHGNGIAVWEQSDGAKLNIVANGFTFGAGWGDNPNVFATTVPGGSFMPRIAMDVNGDLAIVVWEQFDSATVVFHIMANRFVSGTGWGTPELIETDDAGDGFLPQVAMDPSGNAVAVWQQFDGSEDNIVANHFEKGIGWGAAFVIDGVAGDAQTPQVAMDAAGNAVAVWSQLGSIMANSFDDKAGAWQLSVLLESVTGTAGNPQVSVESNGNAVAVWQKFDGALTHVFANRFVAGQGWNDEVLVDNGVNGAVDPDVAVTRGGFAIAVWGQSDGIVDMATAKKFE